MKIKRFEASNMTEALQKIKKEFGEEAVILSAKSTKKLGGFFSNNGSKVVVTAAIDMAPTKKGKGSSDQNLLHDQNKNDGKPMDDVEVK
jgi:flagellar biosynthesis protein FlhF